MMPSRITQHTGGGQNLTQMKAVLEVRGLAAVHMTERSDSRRRCGRCACLCNDKPHHPRANATTPSVGRIKAAATWVKLKCWIRYSQQLDLSEAWLVHLLCHLT